MRYVILNSLPIVIYAVLFCGMSALFFPCLRQCLPQQTGNRNKPVETGLWPPPHMFAVSLWGGQAGNERLLLGRETQAFYLPPAAALLHQRSSSVSLISVCMRRLLSFDRAGKHEATPSHGGCRGVLEQRCFSVWLSLVIHPLPTLVQLGSTLEHFRYWLVAKHLHNNKPCVCLLVSWHVCAHSGYIEAVYWFTGSI